MVTHSYQAINDGSIELGIPSTKFSDTELLDLFEVSFRKGSWQLSQVGKDTGLTIYQVVCGNVLFELYLYMFNVTSSSRERPREHRIQLNRTISNKGFLIGDDPIKKCAIIGLYRYKTETIFCAWHAASKNNFGKQKSCYIDIYTISSAMRDGFSKRKDAAGSVVCAFKPEFIHYYLRHIQELHEESL